ncbi:MAG: hypothetical protein GWO04_28310, partial [Actinobacteria bacterium]|nr:hypothetical protein [Actinomycetota bacterium]
MLTSGLPFGAEAQEDSAPSGSANGFYGSYQDSVPIELPSYRSITPAVSLGYSSSGGNGLVGVGWSLTGFETIERRQNRTGAPRYDGSDTFVYAGDELLDCTSGMVAASCAAGGTHTTRIEGYAKIAFDASANEWTVWQRDGTRAVFTAVYDTSKGTYRWGIRKVIDVHGN